MAETINDKNFGSKNTDKMYRKAMPGGCAVPAYNFNINIDCDGRLAMPSVIRKIFAMNSEF